MTQLHQKVIVFDFDETIGYFHQLAVLVNSIESFLNKKINTRQLNVILDMFFSIFFRPHLKEILDFLKTYKNTKNKVKKIDKVLIYTNNQGPKSWVKNINRSLDPKEEIFDQIIHAFMANGKRVELKRTSHDKNFEDLVSCSRIHSDTQVCFLDDQKHSIMHNDNVYYLQVRPYVHNVLMQNMLIKCASKLSLHESNFMRHCKNVLKLKFPLKTKESLKIDGIVSKRILECLKEFLDGK